MAFFNTLCTYRKYPFRRVILQTFGTENIDEAQRTQGINTAEAPLGKLVWTKYLNPIKGVEFALFLSYRLLDRFSILGIDKFEGVLPKRSFRTLFRLVFVCPLYLLAHGFRWISAPVCTVYRPFVRFLKELWDEGAFGHKVFGQINAGLLVVIALAVAAFIIASIVTGGGLPIFGVLASAIGSIAPVVAAGLSALVSAITFGASSVAATALGTVIVAKILTCYAGFMVGIAFTQRFFEGIIPAIVDKYFAFFTNHVGYSKEEHLVFKATYDACDCAVYHPLAHHVYRNESNKRYTKSNAEQFLMFGKTLVSNALPFVGEQVVGEQDQVPEEEITRSRDSSAGNGQAKHQPGRKDMSVSFQQEPEQDSETEDDDPSEEGVVSLAPDRTPTERPIKERSPLMHVRNRSIGQTLTAKQVEIIKIDNHDSLPISDYYFGSSRLNFCNSG